MAIKKNYLKQNKDNVFKLFLVLILILVLSLIIPAIGIGPSSPALWISIVDFFTSIKVHFASFWMFYSFIALVLFAYMGSSKK